MTIYCTDGNARSTLRNARYTLSTRVNARLEIYKIGINCSVDAHASLRSVVQVLFLSVVLYKFQNGRRRI
jgi:hypothetical protein